MTNKKHLPSVAHKYFRKQSSYLMKIISIIFLSIFYLYGCASVKQNLALSGDKWREDIFFIKEELPSVHKNAFHTVSKEQFDSAISKLSSSLDTLSISEIVTGFQKIVAMIGDGHTYMQVPSSFKHFPIDFFIFNDEVRVTKTIVKDKRALGARLIKVGDTDIEQVLLQMREIVPKGENEWWVKVLIPRYLKYPYVLHGLGLVSENDLSPFTFEDEQGEKFKLTFETIPQGSSSELVKYGNDNFLYEKKPDEDFWFTYLPDTRTIYVNFAGYNLLSDSSQALLDFIDKNSFERLIIDLRNNGGGNYYKGRDYLIGPLNERLHLIKSGKLFVLTSRFTMSAAVVNAIDFRKELNATIVGEPTGGRPNNYGERRQLYLPNSGLTVHYSSEYYKFQEEDTPGVMPDKFIDPLWEDYKKRA